MTAQKLESVKTKILAILPGLNMLDVLIVLLSLASSTSANLLKMPRKDWLDMCAEFYDRRDEMTLEDWKKEIVH